MQPLRRRRFGLRLPPISFIPCYDVHRVIYPTNMLQIASSQSPLGSTIFASISLAVLCVIVLLVLRYYLPLRTTPAYLLVPVFFGLWLPASNVLLVPIDVASNAGPDDESIRGIWLPHRALLVSWRILYWLTFVLTWCVSWIAQSLSSSYVCANSMFTGSSSPSLPSIPMLVTASLRAVSFTPFNKTSSIMPSC